MKIEQEPRTSLAVFLCLGVVVRLIIMPFTIHHDLLSTARRASILVHGGEFLLPYWAELNYTVMLYPLHEVLNGLPITLTHHQNASFSVIPKTDSYIDFVNSKETYSTLFYLKLPFLLVDLLLLYVVVKHVGITKRNLVLWSFNPGSVKRSV